MSDEKKIVDYWYYMFWEDGPSEEEAAEDLTLNKRVRSDNHLEIVQWIADSLHRRGIFGDEESECTIVLLDENKKELGRFNAHYEPRVLDVWELKK